jgi:hypothetical protein
MFVLVDILSKLFADYYVPKLNILCCLNRDTMSFIMVILCHVSRHTIFYLGTYYVPPPLCHPALALARNDSKPCAQARARVTELRRRSTHARLTHRHYARSGEWRWSARGKSKSGNKARRRQRGNATVGALMKRHPTQLIGTHNRKDK